MWNKIEQQITNVTGDDFSIGVGEGPAQLKQLRLEAAAVGGNPPEAEYSYLRAALMQDDSVQAMLPRFVRTSRSIAQFWSYIKAKYGSYQERREYIWEEFRLLFDLLEAPGISDVPAEEEISEILNSFDAANVHRAWRKAMDRRTEDPEAAITSARSLVESVCKHILDEAGVTYKDNSDLPKLYREAASLLNLAPEQHQEEIFKQILGGCHSVVQGLGSVRNKLGDSHGKSKNAIKPGVRHATLAVNLAGSMASFLISSWEEQKQAVQ